MRKKHICLTVSLSIVFFFQPCCLQLSFVPSRKTRSFAQDKELLWIVFGNISKAESNQVEPQCRHYFRSFIRHSIEAEWQQKKSPVKDHFHFIPMLEA